MGITCSCADELEGVSNDPCAAIDYGNQIVKIFIQDESGAQFDGTVTNDVNEEADWQVKLAAVGDDKIVQLPNVAASMPSVEPVLEEGQEIPFGGSEAIEYNVAIEGSFRYLTEAMFAQVEKLTFCQGSMRIWVLTNKLWLFGSEIQANATVGEGFDGAYFNASTMGIDGIGSKTKLPFNIKWTKQCMLKPVAQLPFLKTISA